MHPNQRRDRVLNLVRERERVTVDLLVKETAASPETIRRDLTRLAAAGYIRKFHGGAATAELAPLGNEGEGSFQTRMRLKIPEKRAIARRAIDLFSPGDSLFIDTGTTTIVFAEELARMSPLTVVTNSSLIAQHISRGSKENRVFLLGGEYRSKSAETFGRVTIEQIGRFYCSHAVLTVGALAANGATDYDLEEAEIAIAMTARAQKLTVLADVSKLGRSGLFSVCSLDDIDRLVVDSAPEDEISHALTMASVDVVNASFQADHVLQQENVKLLARSTGGKRFPRSRKRSRG